MSSRSALGSRLWWRDLLVGGVLAGCLSTTVELDESMVGEAIEIDGADVNKPLELELEGAVLADEGGEVEEFSIVVEIAAEFAESGLAVDSGGEDEVLVVQVWTGDGLLVDDAQLHRDGSWVDALVIGPLLCSETSDCRFDGKVSVEGSNSGVESLVLTPIARARAVESRGVGCGEPQQGEFASVEVIAALSR